ncbi:MAG TPA: hypothetical protein VJ748_10810 [Vitreimonas sp.]|jgi:hypothetical protein|nr:hypothetical protein [Vitreimonas sp.]
MGYELLYFIGAIVLLAAIGYGVWQDKTRNKAKDALTEAATKMEYEHPEEYKKVQKQFEDAAKD